MTDSSRSNMPYLLGAWSEKEYLAKQWIDGKVSTWESDLGVVRATIDCE